MKSGASSSLIVDTMQIGSETSQASAVWAIISPKRNRKAQICFSSPLYRVRNLLSGSKIWPRAYGPRPQSNAFIGPRCVLGTGLAAPPHVSATAASVGPQGVARRV